MLTMPSFVEIGPPVPEKKIFERYTIYRHGGHLGHDLDYLHVYIHCLPHPIDASHKICL